MLKLYDCNITPVFLFFTVQWIKTSTTTDTNQLHHHQRAAQVNIALVTSTRVLLAVPTKVQTHTTRAPALLTEAQANIRVLAVQVTRSDLVKAKVLKKIQKNPSKFNIY